jgi:hypothetical protein
MTTLWLLSVIAALVAGCYMHRRWGGVIDGGIDALTGTKPRGPGE